MTKKIKISLTDFTFIPNGSGCYYVGYQSPTSFNIWSAYIHDMTLIDATKNNSDFVKIKDLNRLKAMVKLYCCKQVKFKNFKYNSYLYEK